MGWLGAINIIVSNKVSIRQEYSGNFHGPCAQVEERLCEKAIAAAARAIGIDSAFNQHIMKCVEKVSPTLPSKKQGVA